MRQIGFHLEGVWQTIEQISYTKYVLYLNCICCLLLVVVVVVFDFASQMRRQRKRQLLVCVFWSVVWNLSVNFELSLSSWRRTSSIHEWICFYLVCIFYKIYFTHTIVETCGFIHRLHYSVAYDSYLELAWMSTVRIATFVYISYRFIFYNESLNY